MEWTTVVKVLTSEPSSRLLKGGSIGDYIGGYYRHIKGMLGVMQDLEPQGTLPPNLNPKP